MKPVSHPSNTRTLAAPIGDSAFAAQAPTELQKQQIISEFLERTGQYVTNDATREFAIKCAVDKALQSSGAAQVPAHPDDEAVDRFAAAMKEKLAAARAKGRGGWQDPDCTQERLSQMLREHVEKGDPRDVANFCMFLHQRGEGIAVQVPAITDAQIVELRRTTDQGKHAPRASDLAFARAVLALRSSAGAAQVPSLSNEQIAASARSFNAEYDDGVWMLSTLDLMRFARSLAAVSQPSQQGTKS